MASYQGSKKVKDTSASCIWSWCLIMAIKILAHIPPFIPECCFPICQHLPIKCCPESCTAHVQQLGIDLLKYELRFNHSLKHLITRYITTNGLGKSIISKYHCK